MDLSGLQGILLPAAIIPAVAGLAGLVLGWALTRKKRPAAQGLSGRASRREEPESQEDDFRDLKRTVHLLQNENRNLSTFLLTLPDLARQLNSSTERRKIPPLLIAFIEQLFEAEQILIFVTSSDGKSLVLAAGKGIPETIRTGQTVPFSKGRIGLTAQLGIAMDEKDFVEKTRLAISEGEADRGVEEAGGRLPLRSELAAPMVAKGQTLGVISLGGLLRRPKNEKNMLKMVADLGSIALQNIHLLTAIQASADRDGLTGLYNKRFFMGRLAEMIIDAEKTHQCLSLFIFDIDHFKVYNDTNGHFAGDEALKLTGNIIQQNVRQSDLAARYGGEEFVVLMPATDKESATGAAENMRAAVEAADYFQAASQPLGRVTISGGVATFPFDATTAADLIRGADQALYKGKKAGRNKIFAHSPQYLSGDQTDTNLKLSVDTQKR